jgi:hypothetical protein
MLRRKRERANFNKTEEESQCQPGYIDGASCYERKEARLTSWV